MLPGRFPTMRGDRSAKHVAGRTVYYSVPRVTMTYFLRFGRNFAEPLTMEAQWRAFHQDFCRVRLNVPVPDDNRFTISCTTRPDELRVVAFLGEFCFCWDVITYLDSVLDLKSEQLPKERLMRHC